MPRTMKHERTEQKGRGRGGGIGKRIFPLPSFPSDHVRRGTADSWMANGRGGVLRVKPTQGGVRRKERKKEAKNPK